MSDFYDRLGSDLRLAAARTFAQDAAARTTGARRRRRRLTAGMLVAVVAVTGTATATAPWRPLLGKGGPDGPQPAFTPVPGDQTALLEVLRKPQTARDRGSDVEAELKHLLTGADRGIRLNYVRRLADGPDGRGAVVLIPKESFGEDAPAQARHAVKDALCVNYPNYTSSGDWFSTAITCWGTAQIRAARATSIAPAGSSFHLYGLVPDHVAFVDVTLRNGTVHRVRVRSNFFDLPAPVRAGGGASSPTDVAPDGPLKWVAADGQVIDHPVADAPTGER